MIGRFNEWLKNTIIKISTPIITPIVDLFRAISPAPSTRHAVKEYAIQSVEGFIQATSASNVTQLFRMGDTRRSLKNVVSANLFYMGSVVLFEVGMDNLKYYLADEYLYGLSYPVEILARIYFIRMMSRMYVKNTLEDLAVGKSTADAAKSIRQNHYKSDEGTSSQIQASIVSPLYYMGKQATVSIISRMPYIHFLAFPLQMIVYGQCFLEYNIAAEGMGTAQRNQILADNNAFAFGVGLSFQSSLWLGNYLLHRFTGIQNDFTEDAIFSCIFPYFVVVAHLLGKLPGKSGGPDIFYFSRLVTESLLKVISEKVASYMNKDSAQEDIIEKIRGIVFTTPIQLIEKVILGRRIESMIDIEKIPEIKTLLVKYEKKIRDSIIEVSSVRMTPYMSKALTASNYVTPIIPNFLLSERQLFRVIFDKNTSRILSELKNFMIHFRLRNLTNSYGGLLPASDKDKISGFIDDQIARLREGTIDNEEDAENFSQKISALYELYYLLSSHGAESHLLNIIIEWKKDYHDIINHHRSTVSQLVKMTDTAIFVDELFLTISKSQEKDSDLDNTELRDILARNVINRIKDLQSQAEKISGKYLTREKIQALIELDSFIDDYYKHLSVNQIISIWKEYNWHVISAHRNVSSKMIKNVTGLIKSGDDSTSTAEFINMLMDDYGRLTHRRVETISNEHSTPTPPQKPQMIMDHSVKTVNAIIHHLIEKKVTSLIAERKPNFQIKIDALNQLIDDVDEADGVTFNYILDSWKVNYWNDIIMHRSSTSLNVVNGLISNTFGQVKLTQTNTASFIDVLKEKYGNKKLSKPIAIFSSRSCI